MAAARRGPSAVPASVHHTPARYRGGAWLRRYTHLPAVIHMLRHRVLTLLDPEGWDDSNDSFYIDEYRRRKNLKTTLAVCLAGSEETYHHWKVFAGHPAGVCVRFHAARLLDALHGQDGVRVAPLEYRDFTSARHRPLPLQRFPFVKRSAFGDEREVRVLYESAEHAHDLLDLPIPLDCVARITLSPWLPRALVEATASQLRAIDGCGGLEVLRSSIISSEEWKDLARRADPG
jgi:hypothetical protein